MDCGGSNRNRTRLRKTELQRLADATGPQICVCHFPPGTSKWNKIEHHLFNFISPTWRAKPVVSLEVIINLIAATSTPHRAGGPHPARHAHLPRQDSDQRRRARRRQPPRAPVHPEWNDTIKPQTERSTLPELGLTRSPANPPGTQFNRSRRYTIQPLTTPRARVPPTRLAPRDDHPRLRPNPRPPTHVNARRAEFRIVAAGC